jgi:predicted ATPase/DNA-binding winged helix-turn-helix (wHTH) protein
MVHKPGLGTEQVVSFGPFRLSASSRILYREGEPVTIGSRALDILIALVAHAGEVVSRRELLDHVWPDLTVAEANVRVHVTHLRKALGDSKDVRYVANVPGRGYCFVASVEKASHHQAAASSSPTSLMPSPHNLPPKLRHMVGRDQTVTEIVALLERHRVVSIVGAGGMGKTSVAVAVAHTLVQAFGGAVYFVDAATVLDAALLEPVVQSTLGLTVHSEATLAEFENLPLPHSLLILDNCEHLIGVAATLVDKLIADLPELTVLTTSREALRMDCEYVHRLLPLPVPPLGMKLTVERAAEWPAIQHFIERAAASGCREGLTDDNVMLVADICRRLDGMALAVELAASRAGTYGIAGTANLLDNRFRLHWMGRRNALPRHQTIHAMLDWSYNLLTSSEQVALAMLSIFNGPFTVAAAQRIFEDSAFSLQEASQALASLIDKSLVCATSFRGEASHHLLDTTRAYAKLRLEESDIWHGTSSRHALYCRELLRAGYQPKEDDACRHKAFLADVRAAMDWSFSRHGESAIGVELAARAAPLFRSMATTDECRMWFRAALDTLGNSSCDAQAEMAFT